MTSSTQKMITVVVLISSVFFVSYQNCAGFKSTTSSSSAVATTTTPVTVIAVPTPTSTPVVTTYNIQNNAAIAFKFPRPSEMTTPSDYWWFISNDNGRTFVADQGNIVVSGNNIIISVTTHASVIQGSYVISFFNHNAQASGYNTFLNTQYQFTVNTSLANSTDYLNELCSNADVTKMTLWVDSSTPYVHFFDYGGGFDSTLCELGTSTTSGSTTTFTASTTYPVVYCFTPSTWPTNWNSYAMRVTAWSRCTDSSGNHYAASIVKAAQ